MKHIFGGVYIVESIYGYKKARHDWYKKYNMGFKCFSEPEEYPTIVNFQIHPTVEIATLSCCSIEKMLETIQDVLVPPYQLESSGIICQGNLQALLPESSMPLTP